MNQILVLKNLTRIKRYNAAIDNKWRQEIRQKEQDLVIQYFHFENASQEERGKYHYRRVPRVMRQKWIYEHYGRLTGFVLAVGMALVHHFFASIYATIVWFYRRHKQFKNAGDLLISYPRRSRYYEELEQLPAHQVQQLLEMTQSKTEETIVDAAEKEFENLLKKGINEQQQPIPKVTKASSGIVEGIIPFHLVGIPGPYGERIIDRAKPLREPLPGEKAPIVFDIDELPEHLVAEQQGFFGLVTLAKKETVIIKSYRTADGYLQGYFGGRFVENN